MVPRTTELDLPQTLYTLTLNNVPLSVAMDAIMQQTPINLSVESDVDLTRRVTVQMKQATFAEAMDMVVKNGAGYGWTVENDVLSIKTFLERIYALIISICPVKPISRWGETCWLPVSKVPASAASTS